MGGVVAANQRVEVRLRVNGQPYDVQVEPARMLAQVQREDLGLTGTKIACGMANRGGAVTGYHTCAHTNRSDPANALIAFDAEFLARGRDGERTIPAWVFFNAPQGGARRMNTLGRGQVICEIRSSRARTRQKGAA